jgi:aldehyde dehydrogenase family protein
MQSFNGSAGAALIAPLVRRTICGVPATSNTPARPRTVPASRPASWYPGRTDPSYTSASSCPKAAPSCGGRLRTGIVHVNDQTLNNDAYAPFGGAGASGNGSRFGSQSSWDEFTTWQWVTSREQAHAFPF